MKDESESMCGQRIVFQPLHPDTGDERIIASSSTCYTLLMDRGHPGNFLFCGFEDLLASVHSCEEN